MISTSTLHKEPQVPADFDPVRIREEFPTLDQEVNGKRLVYLDSAATSQKPQAVLEVLASYYERDNANVHRGIHELSRRATIAFEEARGKVAQWVNAAEPAEIVWTRGTTEAINLVSAAWGTDNVSEGDEILISVLEHHSNIIPWQLLARRTGAKLKYIELDDQGRLILDNLSALLTNRTKIVAISHVSNALGTVNRLKDISAAAKQVGALVVVDGAQGAVHAKVDVQELGVDCYAFSGHKMCGPTGIGGLYGREELLEGMDPYMGGGSMIEEVQLDHFSCAEIPEKFEDYSKMILDKVEGLPEGSKIRVVSTHYFDFDSEEKTDRMAEIEQCVDDGFEKINGNFVCSFEVKQIDENLRDRFLNQLLESHKAIIFQTKEKGTELFTLP